jgi:transposase-like protein
MNTISKKLPVFNTDKELSDFLLGNLADSLKQSIKVVVRAMIRQEMDDLRKTVDEKLSFNGNYFRQMLCGLGKIENIEVPRFREEPINNLNLQSLKIFNNEKDKFFTLIAEMHRLGISTRKIEKLCRNIFGAKVGKDRVSAVHKALADEESLRINNQSITDEFEHLLLDGLWVKVKTFGLQNTNKKAILCALGIRPDGTRKILGFALSDGEDYESWNKFILSLKQRGLAGENLKLIIADDNGGLAKALNHLFPKIDVQICMVHKMRNVMSKTKYKNKKFVAEDLKTIYRQETKETAEEQMKLFAKKWYLVEPKAVESLRYDFEKTITYLNFPKESWKKIRTTNILERTFREVRRRIGVFDDSFHDVDSLNRYGNSIIDYLNNNYPARLHTKS